MASAISYNGTVINTSPTIVDAAGAEITSGPFTAMAYGDNGALVTANGTLTPFGIAVAETESKIAAGEDITIQVKESGLWKSGGAFPKGAALTSDANGCAVTAEAGKFILAFALEESEAAGQFIRVQISKSGFVPASSE